MRDNLHYEASRIDDGDPGDGGNVTTLALIAFLLVAALVAVGVRWVVLP